MTKLLSRFLTASILGSTLLFSVVSFADPFANVNITITNVQTWANVNGDVIGPYVFTNDQTNTSFLTMCFDAAHDISFGETYNTNEYNLGALVANGPGNPGAGNPQIEFSGTNNYVQIYEEEAYLANIVLTPANLGTQTAIDAQAAAWDLFDPSSSWHIDSQVAIDEANAAASIGTLNYSQFVIYSPTGADGLPFGQGQMQELPPGSSGNGGPPTPVVPEPSSLALFGSGLFGLAGAVRRRMKK